MVQLVFSGSVEFSGVQLSSVKFRQGILCLLRLIFAVAKLRGAIGLALGAFVCDETVIGGHSDFHCQS